MIVETFEDYASRRGAPRSAFGDAGLHTRGHMSDAAHRRAVAQMVAKDRALADRREALRAEYEAACARGEIRPPTSAETLARNAAGEGPAAQAARNVLAKRAARMAAA